ncbi:MAG TPA: hypothetical protein VKA68_08220 [bacterium]|nr:hypothetical protein [bacterium]
MPKWGIGFISSAVIIGLLLIFFGRDFYPELSTSYDVGWVIFAGILTGGCAGFLLQRIVLSILIGVCLAGLTGGVLFLLLALHPAVPSFSSLLTGILTGGISGAIIQIWPRIDHPRDR